MNTFFMRSMALCIALFTVQLALASIQVHRIQHPVDGQSNGCIDILATGDAGPFTVTINGGTTCAESDGTFSCCQLAPGTYTVVVTDAQGCTKPFDITLENLVCDLQVDLVDRGHASLCDYCASSPESGCADDGFLEIDIQASNVELYEITWTHAVTGNVLGSGTTLSGLSLGLYHLSVVHRDLPDCEFSRSYQIGACGFRLDGPSGCADQDSDLTNYSDPVALHAYDGCNGFILFQAPLSNLVDYHWTKDGSLFDHPATNSGFGGYLVLNDLCAGTYCMHYDNGCSDPTITCLTVTSCDAFAASITSPCMKEIFTEADLDISGGTAPYTVENGIDYLGVQFVRVQDANGCTININVDPASLSPADVDVTVDVRRHFGHTGTQNGAANVSFSIDGAETGGTIEIMETGQVTTFYSTSWPFNIPYEFRDVETFHYIYTAPDGCTIEGTFEIPTCVFPDAGLSFTVDQINPTHACASGQSNSYRITIHNVGDNAPYFFEITMDEAFDPADDDYLQIVPYDGNTVIHVTGIPAGKVRIEARNKCDYRPFGVGQITNCCYDFVCGIYDQGTTEEGAGGGAYFDLPFIRIHTTDLCFVDLCNFGICSDVIVEARESGGPGGNCWEGQVSIIYPDGPSDVLQVTQGAKDQWISQRPEPWRPDGPGSFPITVIYENTCIDTFYVNFYGDGNWQPVVGLDHGLWFNGDHGEFDDAYYGAYRCETCDASEQYIYDRGECQNADNWLFTFFDYEPNTYFDACDGGGELTIIDFVNGLPILTTVIIPPNVSRGERSGGQALARPEGTNCDTSGWCLFDALDVYGFEMDRLILATWYLESSCDEIQDPNSGGGGDPQCDNDQNPCPWPYECHNGQCLEPCDNDNDCAFGDCVGGFCIPNEDCVPPCPSGYTCFEGDCYLDEFCDYYEEVNGGSGSRTYSFYHGLPAGTEIEFWYNALTREDQFVISGSGINDVIACTSGDNTRQYTLGAGGTLTVTINPCETGSRYHFSISCLLDPLVVPSSGAHEQSPVDPADNRLTIYPNPFDHNFNVQFIHQGEGQAHIDCHIYTVTGATISKERRAVQQGSNVFVLDALDDLPNGIYVIKVTDSEGTTWERRLVKFTSFE